MNIFDRENTLRNPRYIGHRGFTPLAPENSLPSFAYAGMLGQWAIETDVHITADGVAVCCHNGGIEAMYGEPGLIAEMTAREIGQLRLRAGNRVECFPDEQLRMPLFSQYLAVCQKYGSVPFIELKCGDVERVLREVKAAGFAPGEVAMSALRLAWLEETRRLAPGMFIHHIFSDDASLERLAEMGNAGISWRVDDPFAEPVALIERAQSQGVRVCLRAADSLRAVNTMLRIGLDYLPTNRMHPM